MAGFRRCNRIIDDSRRVRSLLLGDDLDSGTIRPLRQLLNRCRTEGICRCQDDFLALILELTRKFADRSRLSHSIDTDDKDNGFAILKLVSILSEVHLLADRIDQKLTTLRRLFDMLSLDLCTKILHDRRRGLDSKIAHDQSLLKLLIEILINRGKSAEDRVHSAHNIFSRLVQPLHETAEKSLFLLFHSSTSISRF